MVRPTSDIYSCFDSYKEVGVKGQTKFKCKYCGQTFTKNATKMRDHISRICKQVPGSVKSVFEVQISTLDHKNGSKMFSTANRTQNSIGNGGTVGRRTMSTFVDTISDSEKDKMWRALAKAIYVSGNPLSLLEEPHWIEAFKVIRPALTLPSRHLLSNQLLDQEYYELQDSIKQEIAEARYISLQCDGWTNVKNESVLSFVVTTWNKSFLYKTVHTEENRHTTEYMFEESCKIIEELGSDKVVSFTTDNTNNMKSTLPLIEARYANVTAFGCVAHGLNLLVENILGLPLASDFLTTVTNVVTKPRRSSILNSYFEKFQKEENPDSRIHKLLLPIRTRWSSFEKSLKSIIATKQSLMRLAIDSSSVGSLGDNICGEILSQEFWRKAECYKNILSPISKWLKVLEYEWKSTTSLVPKIFSELEKSIAKYLETSTLPLEDQKFILSMLEERKMFSRKSIHLAANLLDPKEKGFSLTGEEVLEATEFIANLAKGNNLDFQDAMTELALYKTKQGIFSKQFLWDIRDSVDGHVWWANIPNSSIGACAEIILGVPSTSVPTERTLSTYGSILSSSRNRLTKERAGKLVFIAHNLRGQRRRKRAFTEDPRQDETRQKLRAVAENSAGPSSEPRNYNMRERINCTLEDSNNENSDDEDSDDEFNPDTVCIQDSGDDADDKI